MWQPYLCLAVLRNFGAGDDVTFGDTQRWRDLSGRRLGK
jgi:hypothetical protein